VDLGRVGIDEEGDADHDRAEIEGPGDGGGDDDQRERRPLVGTGQAPAPTSTLPTSLAAGQDGEAISAWPMLTASRALAAAMSPSEQYGTPARRPVRPLGRVVSIALSRCEPSGRVTLSRNGL
jgi:hypothetical protein